MSAITRIAEIEIEIMQLSAADVEAMPGDTLDELLECARAYAVRVREYHAERQAELAALWAQVPAPTKREMGK